MLQTLSIRAANLGPAAHRFKDHRLSHFTNDTILIIDDRQRTFTLVDSEVHSHRITLSLLYPVSN